MYLLAYDLIDRSYSDEYTATEKWRLCWGNGDLLGGFAYFSPLLYDIVYLLYDIFLNNLGLLY